MRMKNADLKEKLEFTVRDFQDKLEGCVERRLHDVISEISCEIDCKVDYFLQKLLIDLGLKKKRKLTITEKQIKKALDEYVKPAMLEQVYKQSPMLTRLQELEKKENK